MTAADASGARAGKRALAFAAAATLVALLVPSSALAQEATPTPTAGEGSATLLRVEAPPGPFSEGDEFDVQLMVENVEHLGALEFYIEYDSDQLRLVSGQMEPLFLEAERQADCSGPNGWVELSGSVDQIETELNTIQGAVVQANEDEGRVTAWFPASETDKALQAGQVERTRVFAFCVSRDAPASLGGPAGVSGSGALATMTFEARGDGKAELWLQDTRLLLDDIDPPGDPTSQTIPSIPHETESASVELEGSGGGSSWLIIAVAAALAVALVVVGGLILLRRGGRGPSGPDSAMQA